MKTPAAAAFLLCLGACTLLDREAVVTVLLPPAPAPWVAAFPGMCFLVVCPDGSGQFREMMSGPGQSCVHLSCSKGVNTPVLAYPLIAEGDKAGTADPGSLRPAGGIFPASVAAGDDGLNLLLSWQDGPVALVLHRLFAAGMDVLAGECRPSLRIHGQGG